MPEQRMSAQLTRLAKKRGRLPALVTALGLLALMAAQEFLASFVNYLGSLGYIGVDQAQPENSGLHDITIDNSYQFTPSIDTVLHYLLPFALGVFVALWLLAPISDELTARFVITRAGLAALAASLLVILVNLVLGLVWSVGAGGFDSTFFLHSVVESLTSGLLGFIFKTPLVMFAGVLLWLWLRDHPREYAVAGLIDEL
jgi:hypothetical protein